MEPDRKAYKCEFCNYTTVEKSNLSRHTRTHSSLKQFSCPHCSHRTNDQSNLKVHIRRKHTPSINTKVQNYDNTDTNMQIKHRKYSDNSALQEKKDTGCSYFINTLKNQNQETTDIGDLTGFGYESTGCNKKEFEGLLAEWNQQKSAVNLQTSHFIKANTGGKAISSGELEMQDFPHSPYGQQGIPVSNLLTSATSRTATNNCITNITEVPCVSGVLPESQSELFATIPVAYSHTQSYPPHLTEDFHGACIANISDFICEEDNRYRHFKHGTDLIKAPAAASAFQQDPRSQHTVSSQRRILPQQPHKQFQPHNYQHQFESRQSILTNRPQSQQKEDRNILAKVFPGWESYSTGNWKHCTNDW